MINAAFERVKNEAINLLDKINKLKSFIYTSKKFNTLSVEMQDLLKEQLITMKRYYNILIDRINIWSEDE